MIDPINPIVALCAAGIGCVVVAASVTACREGARASRVSAGIAAPARTPYGTYELLLCRVTCDSTSPRNTIRSGWIMLDSASVDTLTIPDSFRPDFSLEYLFMGIDGPANGCFVLRVDRADVKTYAGLFAGGLTHWTRSARGDSLSFPLYGSPDAGHEVRAALTARGFEGLGHSWGGGVTAVDYPDDIVVGRYVGPPVRSRCADAAAAARAQYEEWRRTQHTGASRPPRFLRIAGE
jgi:hypothetical protein